MGIESELLRLVEALRREKDINPEVVFQGIEAALVSAARKHFGGDEGITITIDRTTGAISAFEGEREINPVELGRIAAQTAKQVMIQKIREAERDSIAGDFTARIGTVINGTVYRFEGPNIVVNLGRTEGFLPRSEQIANEVYRQGDRIRAQIIEVKPVGTRVRVVLSRSRPGLVQALFELEVPEVAEGIVHVEAIAREAGYRTKIAVSSSDSKVDCVGACVGVQGARIRNVVEELNGEKIDIIRWSEDPEQLIAHTLKPAEVDEIRIDEATGRATVIVPDDQLSLAIGKRGQNVRLACKLTGWEIDITTRAQMEGGAKKAEGETAAVAAAASSEEAAAAPAEEVPAAETPVEPSAEAASEDVASSGGGADETDENQ